MKRALLIMMAVIFCWGPRAAALEVSAEYACVMLADTGEVVYEKNAYTQYPMASTTKIMTALLALESCGLEEVVTVSRNASLQEGSSMYLHPGDKITMENLLYGLMLNSGNDAAVAIAEHIAGNAEEFAQQMTARARALGAESTQFQNPNGLDAEGHYTTARDLALITREAMQNETFRQIVATKTKAVPLVSGGAELYLANHNKMLKLYDGATGVKTGFTKSTGRCLVSSAERDGVALIAVTLRAPDDWNDHARMLDDAFEKYERKIAVQKGMVVKEVPAGEQVVNAVLAEEVFAVCRKEQNPSAEVTLHLAENLTGPVEAGEKIGYAEVKTGAKVTKVDILCDRTVERSSKGRHGTLKTAFLKILATWCGER